MLPMVRQARHEDEHQFTMRINLLKTRALILSLSKDEPVEGLILSLSKPHPGPVEG